MNTQRVEGHTPKDCPFCGAIPELFSPNEDYSDVLDIRCGTEGCFLQHGADYLLDRYALIARWNLRNSNIERLEKVNETLVMALEEITETLSKHSTACGECAPEEWFGPSEDERDKAVIAKSRAALSLAKEPA